MLKKDHAVCIRKVDYSETSQVVTLFTRESGKVAFMAKGSRRKKSSFDGAVELFSFGDIVYALADTGKLSTLTEFQQSPIYFKLRSNYFALNCAMFASELIDHLTTEHDANEDIFDEFIQFLTDVQDQTEQASAITLLILFQLTLLNLVGTMPVLNCCVNCRVAFKENWNEIYFSSTSNGLVCPDCEQAFVDKTRLSKQSAGCLSDLRQMKDATYHTLKDIEKVLIYHFTSVLGKVPRMAKFFITY